MSRIFDALQRLDKDQSGDGSSASSDATALLQRAELRANAKWHGEKMPERKATAERDEPLHSITSNTADFNGAKAIPPLRVEDRPAASTQHIFAGFQTLPASPVPERKLISFTDPDSAAAESFRLLGVRLRQLRRSTPLKTVLVTSTIPQEGKSTVAANLACTLAKRTSQKVLLLEGDLRRPTLSEILGIARNPGICQFLQAKQSLSRSVYSLPELGLWLLPAGTIQSNPLELLQSSTLASLMEQLAALFDWIIIDSPPVLPLADTSVWSRMADGILLVVRQGITEKRQLLKGLEALDSRKLIRAVVNGSTNSDHKDYYYYRPAASSQESTNK